MATYLCNAFSLSMLAGFPADKPVTLRARRVSLPEVKTELFPHFFSAVGHPDTAGVLSELLGVPVPINRINITLSQDDVLVVAQYSGPRLPERSTSLPEGASFDWWVVKCEPGV